MTDMNPEKLEQNAEKASTLLKAMSNPSRLMVLCHLLKGESPVSEINQAVPLSQSALSQHLAGLRKAGIVETRREGQVIFYHLHSRAASEILQTLYRIYCTPEPNKEQEI